MLGIFKHYLPEDFFQGAHDIHCHLLPGVDDGFGGKNIQVAAEGWYVLHFIVKVAGTELEYTLDLNPAEVFTIGDATGNWDGTKMTPNSDGIFVSEAFTAGGELRAYVKVSGVEWWQSEFTYNKNDNKIVWRTDKQNIQFNWTDLGDEYSIDCAAGQKLYVDFKSVAFIDDRLRGELVEKGFFTGTVVGSLARFLVHYLVGVWVWGEYMPDTFFGMTMTTPWFYSFLYNGSYMLVDMILCLVIGALLWKPMGKYLRGEDTRRA